MTMKRLILAIALVSMFISNACAYNSYDGAGTWNNTSYSGTIKYPNGAILLNNKLTDYYSFWTFDESSGTVTDLNTTTNLPLTISGGTRNTTSSFYGSSLSLSGANGQYASPGTGFDWTSGNWTMSAWIKSVGYPTQNSALAGRWGGDKGYMVYFVNGVNGQISIYSDGTECYTATGTYPSDSVWHHMVAIKTGTTCNIYLDGVSKSVSGTLSNSWTTAGAGYRFEIGTYSNDAGANFNGLIDEFKLWKRALNATEAGNLYNSTYLTAGNFTSFYLAPAGNITNKITINVTTPTSTNYTAWYKNSTGGTFAQLSGGTLTGNNSWDQAAFLNTTVEVRAAGRGNVTTKGIQITYGLGASGNTAPVLAAIGAKSATTRSWLNITLNATDANGDTITYGTNATKGSLNNATGAYTWNILSTENGTYNFNFTASDPYGGVDYEVVTVTVSTALPFTLPAVYTSWWNTSWTYRTSSIIPDGARPYQLRINVSNSSGTNNATHLFCNGHCRPNFTDIRFTLDNGTALPYWIENATSGLVWVNLTANGSINMYYGNTTVASAANGNTTFILFDDFPGTTLNTTKWSVSGSGSTEVFNSNITLKNPYYIYSKNKYTPASNGDGYFMRTYAKRNASDATGWGGIGFSTSYSKGDDTKISYSIDWWSSNTKFDCSDGKDSIKSQEKLYATNLDSNYHISEMRRGGTNDSCILDTELMYMLYPSTIARYLSAEAYSINLTIDYIFVGNYRATSAPVWATWGAEGTGTVGTKYIPPIPVLAEEINASDGSWRYVAWSEGWGNITDAYVVGLNDVYTVNTHIQTVNETLSPHERMNVSVYSLNYSNSTVNLNFLESNYQRPNRAPVLTSIGNKRIYQNMTLDIQMTVSDLDSDTITYGTNATKGTLNNATGAYSFASVPADVGTYTWYFNATDGYGGEANETITVTVSSPKTLTIQLYTGWQTVLVNDSQTMDSLSAMFSPSYIAIWDSTEQAWQKYKSGWSYNQNLEVSRDQAAMILVTVNGSKSFNISAPFNWTLTTGQNLVGVPENMTLSQLNTSVGGCANVDEMTYIYPNNLSEKTYTCENGINQTNASVMVEAGRGVWMNAVQTVDIKNAVG